MEEFRNPPVEYRPVPFLSVNDDVTEDRLAEFAREFQDKGWGGLFFHARVGLVTPYMGNRWFNLVKSLVELYREIGGRFWIYDEQGWPSGQAGGQVTRLRTLFRSKLMLCRERRGGIPIAGTIRSEKLRLGGRKVRVDFAVKTMPQSWLPDLLEPATVRAFLESTHELYKIHVGDEFGGLVPGVFTDEPQYATHHSQVGEPAVPWTDRLPGEFQDEHGYSILDNLSSLFFDQGEHRRVRYDFYSTLTRLFVEAYTKQIFEWCERHGLAYTGHYEWEDSFLGQIHCIGSAMQHYEYMQQPGIDHLGRGLHNPWVEKQVASVASQLGRSRVLSETYGVGGQDMSFHDRRWIATWQYALGINFLNHHVALYSLRGERKRDYPPTLSPHQPWWRHNRVVADYFARLSYLLSQGRRLVDVLLISSIGAAWCEYKPSDPGPVEKLFDGFTSLTSNLLESQIDFEYGEEVLMERHGSIDGKVLRVGESSYRVAILPPMGSIRESTYLLLKEFAEAGGSVICVGSAPTMVEGRESDDLGRFVSSLPLIPNERTSLSDSIKPLLSEGPSITWVEGAPMDRLLVHRRAMGKREILFLVNTEYERTMTLDLDFRTRRPITEFLPLSGEVKAFPRARRLSLAAGEGRAFVVGLRSTGGLPELGDVLESAPVAGRWRISRMDPNQAVLDYARWRRPDGRWSKLMPVWRVQEALRSPVGEEFEVRYEFEAHGAGEIDLVLEDAQKLDLYVNGERVESKTESWWLDPSFKRIPLRGRIREGRNSIVAKGRADPDLSIEDAYLLGDFGVHVKGRRIPLLVAEETTVEDISDIREQGYPFYAGTIELEALVPVEPREGSLWIEFDRLGGTVAEVALNERSLGALFWREYRLRAKGAKPGVNRVRLRLTSSLRNLLGPRHWTQDEFTGVNPNSFKEYHGWTDEYIGVPLGVKGLKFVWRKEG